LPKRAHWRGPNPREVISTSMVKHSSGVLSKGPLQLRWVNLYVLQKQHLLKRAKDTDISGVIRDIVALHATSAATPYLSLWVRISGFRREMLDKALYDRRARPRASDIAAL
jgi:hypothetical protein